MTAAPRSASSSGGRSENNSNMLLVDETGILECSLDDENDDDFRSGT
jgi:hypothetical protein